MGGAPHVRPLIIGMNNPQGNQPLWPDPPGCSGHRLWKMLSDFGESRHKHSISKTTYLRTFDRVNIIPGPKWEKNTAKINAPKILDLMKGRTTILLGRQVQNTLALPQTSWLTWSGKFPDLLISIPHPSGLTRSYNDPHFRELVGSMLYQLYSATLRPAG